MLSASMNASANDEASYGNIARFCGAGNHVDLRGLLDGAEGIRTAMLSMMRLGDCGRLETGWMQASPSEFVTAISRTT
jgi:hypothetical protein